MTDSERSDYDSRNVRSKDRVETEIACFGPTGDHRSDYDRSQIESNPIVLAQPSARCRYSVEDAQELVTALQAAIEKHWGRHS